MNVRQAIAKELTDRLPDSYIVKGYTYDPDAAARPTVMLWQSLIERGSRINDRNGLEVTVELWVIVGSEDPAKVDDDLDDALDEVLTAVHDIPFIDWSVAERGVLKERFHGYRMTARAVATIGTEAD